MEKIFVIPKKGVLVRDVSRPGCPHINAEGEYVHPSFDILRRIKDGDLVKGIDPNAEKKGE